MGIGAIASKGYGYVRRGMKIAPDFVLGTGNEAFSKTLEKSFYGVKDAATGKRVGGQYFNNFWGQFKDAAKAAEKNNLKNVKLHGGFFKNLGFQLKTTPKLMSKGWQLGAKAAKAAGKNSFWGGLKGSLGAIGKRLPLIGSVLMVAMELPNIISATKDKGIGAGATEAVKAAARIGGGMAGAALGTALIPIPVVGSVVGYMLGDKLVSLVTGKSHSEKKMEQEEQLAQQQQQMQEQLMMQQQLAQQQMYAQNPMQGTGFDTGSTTNPFASQSYMTPQQLSQMQQMLYGGNNMNDDFMYMTMMNRFNAKA